MPRSGLKCTDALGIKLDDFRPWYLPGETLAGHVVRKPALDKPSNTVTLMLFGRAKSKIVSNDGQSISIYRGRAVFFSEMQQIHRGSIAEDAKLPFSVTIPNAPSPGMETRGDVWDKDKNGGNHYLSTSGGDVSEHKLPPSFYYRASRTWGSKKAEAYVEYGLRAELKDGSRSVAEATFPLFIRSPASEEPIKDFRSQTRMTFVTIKTPRLLPELADTKMSFRQRSSRLFRPSKTPKYSFSVRVEHPMIVQLDHPEPIPFNFYVVPNVDPQWTSICPDGDISNVPPVRFVRMTTLKLISCTRVRCHGTFSTHESDKQHDWDFRFQEPVTDASFDIPVTTQASAAKPGTHAFSKDVLPKETEFKPFPLGAHLALHLNATGASTLGNPPVPFPRGVMHPSFKTYNIDLSYRLEWAFEISCAGETRSIRGVSDVAVLPPSERQERKKIEDLGDEGVKKNYDDLLMAAGLAVQGLEIVVQIVESLAG